MDKLTVLFIRACKANDPEKRLRSLYRRFFLSGATDSQYLCCAISRLADICDTYLDGNANYLVSALSPSNAWKYEPVVKSTNNMDVKRNPQMHYLTKTCNVLVSRIRFSSVDKFPGLPTPARFRRAPT